MPLRLIIGIIAGGTCGYLLYRKLKCPDGTCNIIANPFLMIFYGALLGLMISYYLFL